MSQETIERRFEVGTPAKLKLSNVRGPVELLHGDEGAILINATKYLDSGNEERTRIEIEQKDDGQVVVKTEYDNPITNWFGLNRPCKVAYTVHLPRECEARVNGVSSDISAQGLSGSIDINTVSGKLELCELSGLLKLSTVSGPIKAEKLTGELDANSVSGRVRVMESQVSKALVKSVSGSMILQTPLQEGPYTFNGVSGSAALVVPEDTSCTAKFKSVSGRMRTSLPVSKDHRLGSSGTMEVQGGGVEVSYKCVSGSFKILTAENQVVREQKAKAAPSDPTTNPMDILKKIEAGEISVDDALKELNA